MAVNISQSQFSDPGFAKRILQVLADTRFPAARLELEITEKSLLDDFNSALAIIASLKNNGISVSVDDFGMGYASLAELRALPFDRLKIDRRFIASFLEDRGRVAFVEAIATLGKGLKVPITAEGVEAESLRAKLLELGCCDAQGWVFARALSANEVDLGFGRDWAKPASAALADPSARSATGS
jgi:EAL domain-containing protein (putative c-di-GMP-specific phosphodiesterase class I)